jgi:hypothetical protein
MPRHCLIQNLLLNDEINNISQPLHPTEKGQGLYFRQQTNAKVFNRNALTQARRLSIRETYRSRSLVITTSTRHKLVRVDKLIIS